MSPEAELVYLQCLSLVPEYLAGEVIEGLTDEVREGEVPLAVPVSESLPGAFVALSPRGLDPNMGHSHRFSFAVSLEHSAPQCKPVDPAKQAGSKDDTVSEYEKLLGDNERLSREVEHLQARLSAAAMPERRDQIMSEEFEERGTPEQLAALYGALAIARGKFPDIKKTATVNIKSANANYQFKYAPLDEMMSACTPALSENGLVVILPFGSTKDGAMVRQRAILAHKDGARLVAIVSWPPSEDMKVFGGETTYMGRYAYRTILGISADSDLDEMPVTRGKVSGEATSEQRQRQAPSAPPREQQRPQEPAREGKATQPSNASSHGATSQQTRTSDEHATKRSQPPYLARSPDAESLPPAGPGTEVPFAKPEAPKEQPKPESVVEPTPEDVSPKTTELARELGVRTKAQWAEFCMNNIGKPSSQFNLDDAFKMWRLLNGMKTRGEMAFKVTG